MSVVAFDTLKFARALEQRGFTHEQATGASDALSEALGGLNVASKTDLLTETAALRTELKQEAAALRTEMKAEFASVRAEFKSEIATVRAEIKSSAAETKADILRWLVVTQIALAGFLFAAIRYVH